MKAAARNRYILAMDNFIEVDIFAQHQYGWGFDFYINVLQKIEENRHIAGFTFYLSYRVPNSIPEINHKTVLILLADENYEYKAYFRDLCFLFRCIGSMPVYLEGFPTTELKRAAFLHFLYKMTLHVCSVLKAFKTAGRIHLFRVTYRTAHIPLGLFWTFESDRKPIGKRKIDYAFLGSIAFDIRQRKWFHRFFDSPKLLSRRQMIEAMRRISPRFTSKIYTTGDFEESIANRSAYVETMLDTKISVVPRGTSYETLRFFESIKAGCIVICEKLPKKWCYENNPAIIIDDWADLPRIIAELLDNPGFLEKRAIDTYTYWETRCSESAVAQYIENKLKNIL